MVKTWFAELSCGRIKTRAPDHSGRPTGVDTPKTIGKIDDVLLANWRLKMSDFPPPP